MIRISSEWSRGGGVFFQAEDGIRDLVRSRGLGDVYKRQERMGRGQRGGDLGAEVVGILEAGQVNRTGAHPGLSLIHI